MQSGKRAVEANVMNERFTAVCFQYYWSLKLENFTLLFCRQCQNNGLNCVLHLQHDYWLSCAVFAVAVVAD